MVWNLLGGYIEQSEAMVTANHKQCDSNVHYGGEVVDNPATHVIAAESMEVGDAERTEVKVRAWVGARPMYEDTSARKASGFFRYCTALCSTTSPSSFALASSSATLPSATACWQCDDHPHFLSLSELPRPTSNTSSPVCHSATLRTPHSGSASCPAHFCPCVPATSRSAPRTSAPLASACAKSTHCPTTTTNRWCDVPMFPWCTTPVAPPTDTLAPRPLFNHEAKVTTPCTCRALRCLTFHDAITDSESTETMQPCVRSAASTARHSAPSRVGNESALSITLPSIRTCPTVPIPRWNPDPTVRNRGMSSARAETECTLHRDIDFAVVVDSSISCPLPRKRSSLGTSRCRCVSFDVPRNSRAPAYSRTASFSCATSTSSATACVMYAVPPSACPSTRAATFTVVP
eukprot:Sspe_Gene.20283::Locus_7437_Transcript_1_1_Confidence_1.000_Length_1423::g.20283::m.20283